jgi:RNA polymerase sigma-70 factor, ECF subfamily
MAVNDQTLIEKAQNGDRAAFQQLLEQNYNMIYRVAYRFTGHNEDAEDVAQEVCVGLVHKLKSFRGESSFSSWLYRIIVNTCHDLHKKRKNHRELEHKYTEYENLDNAGKNDGKLQLAWLYRTLATLEQPYKETALLVLTEGISHAQAGEILGCAESTISWRMSEVRKMLKSKLDSYHG